MTRHGRPSGWPRQAAGGSEDDDEKGGDLRVVAQEDDDTPIYAGIEPALNGVAAEK